jgi:multidrug transporter EmrE-like cation transporter
MGPDGPPREVLSHAAQGSLSSSAVASLGLLIVSVVFSLAGQLTLKSAMTRVGRIGAAEVVEPVETLARAAREPRLWVGLAAFGISALFWLVVLSRVPLSVAYPFVGLSYVGIVLLSRTVLHESVPPLRWVGVCVVSLGIALVGLSFRRASGI